MEKKNTALQELIEKIDEEISEQESSSSLEAHIMIDGLLCARNFANALLEKEKQMVIDAHFDAVKQMATKNAR